MAGPKKEKQIGGRDRLNSDGRMGNSIVLPETLPPEVVQILQKMLHEEPLRTGFSWVLKHVAREEDVLRCVEQFLGRYEEQISYHTGEALRGHELVFRAALMRKCLEVLPHFRMAFATCGCNPLFIRTWLQKRLLATMMGITTADIDRKARASNQRMPHFLNENLTRVLGKSCLDRL